MARLADLGAYLQRIGVEKTFKPSNNLETLTRLMEAQSRSISFENLDVVQRKAISMVPADVEAKLVVQQRGGYCFEQNTLLLSALLTIGYDLLSACSLPALHPLPVYYRF